MMIISSFKMKKNKNKKTKQNKIPKNPTTKKKCIYPKEKEN